MWIAFAGFMAGLVRGFSGFGTALIYLPIASMFLSPVQALVTLTVMDSIGPLPAIPRAAREADWPDLRKLLLGMVLALPLGLLLLLSIPADVFRYGVSFGALLMLIVLLFGFRFKGRLSAPKVYGVGAASGVLGGSIGLPGPPVIFFYMSSDHPARVIRATTMVFLLCFDFILLGMLGVQGLASLSNVVLGALLTLPLMLGTLLGTWLFRPSYEKAYRGVAYIIIAVSALRGLPIWG